MAEISLRAYLEYIEDRLNRDAYGEVAAQCRHILETYPKHIETYKLLARALASQPDEHLQDALDMFQRVLSADPNDFIAHIGMSDCYRESNALDQAIWHLERAFEQTPNNLELQEEIKRLYVQRDNKAPRKIHLTSGALARMYTKGKLYDQAIAEIRKGIAKDPERLDLQVLLANALWESRQEVEAGRVAAAVLKRLPFSIDANRILAQLWLKVGQPGEARPFLDRVRELDPILGYQVEHGESAPADAIRLTMLDYSAARMASEGGAADWVSQIEAIEKSKGVTGPLNLPEAPRSITDIFTRPSGEETQLPAGEQPADLPDWLHDTLGSIPGAPTPAAQPAGDEPEWLREALGGAAPAEPAAPSIQPPGEDQPDWLREALGGEPPSSPAPAPPAQQADAPDWLQDALGGTPAPPPAPAPGPSTGEPDWLQEALLGGSPPVSGPAPSAAPSPAGEVEIPDWFDSLGEPSAPARSAPAQPPAAAGPPAPAEPVPDWLQEIHSAEAPGGAPAHPGEEREVPAWLSEILSEEPTAAAAPAPAQQEAPEVVSDDWLDTFLAGGPPIKVDEAAGPPRSPAEVAPPPPPPAPVPAPQPVQRDLGGLETWDGEVDWLKPEAQEPASEAEQPIPDWLGAGRPETDEVPISSFMQEPSAPAAEEGELPDWLRGERPETEEIPLSSLLQGESEDEAIPDWLTGTPAPQAEAAPAAPVEEGVPDWLAGTAAPAASAADEEGELPDWLRGAEPAAAGTPSDQSELPDWMADTAAPVSPEPAVESGMPDWLRGAEPAAASVSSGEGVPDWLAGTAAPVASGAGEEETPDWLRAAEPADAGVLSGEGELPDWLAGTEAPAASGAGEEEMPDWLRGAEPAAEAFQPSGVEDEEGIPDWLSGTPQPAQPSPMQTRPIEEPDWLSGADEPAASQPSPMQTRPIEEPDWLSEMGTPGAAAAPSAPSGEIPDWLKGAPDDFVPLEGAPAAPPREEIAADWLGSTAQPEAAEREEEALPDWLGEPEEEAPAPAAEVEEAELPDWMRSAEPEASTAAADEEELPDWLTAAPSQEAEPEEELSAPGWLQPADTLPASTAEFDDDTPDWLRMMGGEEVQTATPAGEEEHTPIEMPEPARQEERPVASDEPIGGDDQGIPDWMLEGDLDSDDAIAWLTELAAKYDPDFQANEDAAAAPPAAEAAAKPAEEEEMPSWLQEAPVAQAEEDEMPSWLKSEEAAAPAAAKEGEDALAWLDQEVTEQGVSPTGVVSEQLTPDHPPVAAPPPPPPDAEAVPVSDEELPEWLRGDEVQAEIERAMDKPSADAELAELPDLEVEDEELAWLTSTLEAEERVAGAGSLDDFLAEDDGGDEGLPAWLKGEEGKPAPAQAAQPAAVEDEGLPDWLKDEEEEEAAPAMTIGGPAVAEPTPPVAEAKPAEEEEELPSWLMGVEEGEEEAPVAAVPPPAPPEPISVPIPEPVRDDEPLPAWLQAPTDTVDTGLDDFLKAAVPAAEPAVPAAPPPAPPPAAPPRATSPLPPPPAPAPVPAAAGPVGEGLEAARRQISLGQNDEAFNNYEALVASGQSLDEVVEDLNTYVTKNKFINPRAFRLLGDAMMAQGKLQDALEMYRRALDSF